jgi:hypothetical protein
LAKIDPTADGFGQLFRRHRSDVSDRMASSLRSSNDVPQVS